MTLIDQSYYCQFLFWTPLLWVVLPSKTNHTTTGTFSCRDYFVCVMWHFSTNPIRNNVNLTSALLRSLQLALKCGWVPVTRRNSDQDDLWYRVRVLLGLLCWESCDSSWPITPLSVLAELALLVTLRTFLVWSDVTSETDKFWNIIHMYHELPKNLDTETVTVKILKLEQCGFTIYACVQKLQNWILFAIISASCALIYFIQTFTFVSGLQTFVVFLMEKLMCVFRNFPSAVEGTHWSPLVASRPD